MRGFVAPTDHDWYQFLRARPHLDEVNFWRPGGTSFAALRPGELFFFKLKRPYHAIGGFGQFSRFATLPVWMAWDVFGEANGASTRDEFLERLRRLTRLRLSLDHEIGCISIAFPTFFAPDDWVLPPSDWKPNIVSGRSYDLTEGEGERLWHDCATGAVASSRSDALTEELAEQLRFGAPRATTPRLGQGSFRLAVLDAYGRACAVTTEHSLPVLEAAHIRPYSEGGMHAVSNGLPLRRDLHRLFDLGFVTVLPDRSFRVSRHLREDYANGRIYYELDGRRIATPRVAEHQPNPELLEWHADVVFRR